MHHRRNLTISAAGALAVALMTFGSASAFAHGGAVDPPNDQQDCRNLAVHEKGEGGHAQDGLDTAGENSAAVDGGHCG